MLIFFLSASETPKVQGHKTLITVWSSINHCSVKLWTNVLYCVRSFNMGFYDLPVIWYISMSRAKVWHVESGKGVDQF